MYVTKRLSHLLECPSELSLSPPEGPNSGFLVIQDEKAEPTCCFGVCRSERIRQLPFPQNKKLELSFATGFFPKRQLHFFNVCFIPVLNKPLDSNLYYAVRPYGKDRGAAFISSKEEDVSTCCCFCNYVDDEPPCALNPHNKLQQFDIHSFMGNFTSKSLSPNSYPPQLLRKKWWRLDGSDSKDFSLGEASGLNSTLRAQLPEFNFSSDLKASNAVVVGKWYCPFMFVKEGTPRTLGEEMYTPMFYEMTLEQRWEQIFTCENELRGQGNVVEVKAEVLREVVMVAGREASVDERSMVNGTLWFRSYNNQGEESRVGLNLVVCDRMKWEEERVGWVSGDEKKLNVERLEEFDGENGLKWKHFGCYVLVERFVLRRMDGSLVLTHDFSHTHQIRSKWD